jgi:hypothetical protein
MNDSNLVKTKKNKCTCDICQKEDPFLFCSNCFQNFCERGVLFKKSLNFEKYNLRSGIQDTLTKNQQKLYKYNRVCLKSKSVENNTKRISELNNNIKSFKNRIISITDQINKKKEMLILVRRFFDEKNEMIRIGKDVLIYDNSHLSKLGQELYNRKKLIWERIIEVTFIKEKNLIDVSEFFEIHEYVKANVNSKDSKYKDLSDFDKIPNILSKNFTNSLSSPRESDVDINYDKFIKLRQHIFKNTEAISKLNSYIYLLMACLNQASKIFNISLPYFMNLSDFSVIGPLSNESGEENKLRVYLSNLEQGEISMSKLVSGYIYIDSNLKCIKRYFNYPVLQPLNISSRKNYDIKEFLNIISDQKKIKEIQPMGLEKEKTLINNHHQYENICSYTEQREDNDFVIIDNFYK